jgi:hypothetical protein
VRLFPIRARLFLWRCRWSIAFIAAWFAFGTAAYRVQGLRLGEALQNALYLGNYRGPFWDLYSFWGQCVLFGILVSVFALQAVQQYNPQEACRMLASEMKDHTIVVGYNHLGTRIVAHLRAQKRPFVVVDKNPAAMDDLVRDGEPVVVDNAREESTLVHAGVERAKLVIVALDDVETAMLVTKRARERNRRARIIVRCYLDEFTEILEGLGANEVVSCSKSAFREVERHL